VKSDLQAVITSYAHTVYYNSTCFWDGIYIEAGAASATAACSLSTNSITLYSSDFALGNGSVLYFDSNLSNPWYSDELCGGTPGYYLVGEYSFRYYTIADILNISEYTLCAGQTSYAITNCGISNSSAAGACSDAGTNPKTLYSECATLSAGCSIHFNSNLTNPVTDLYVFAQASWDMDGYGIISNYSSIQC
jgi:hypothetical protein